MQCSTRRHSYRKNQYIILDFFVPLIITGQNGQQQENSPLENPSKRAMLDSSVDQAGYSLHLLYSYTMQTPGKNLIIIFYRFCVVHIKNKMSSWRRIDSGESSSSDAVMRAVRGDLWTLCPKA